MAIHKQCCVCYRVYDGGHLDGPGQWLPTAGKIPRATHAYCPDCLAQVRAELRALAQHRRAEAAAGL